MSRPSTWLTSGAGWPTSVCEAEHAVRSRAGLLGRQPSQPGRYVRGLTQRDVGALLARPKALRTLPAVLRADQVKEAIECAKGRAESGDPAAIRDWTIIEVLYATGIRVGELAALDVDDLDGHRRTIKVLGKGGKERTVPYGVPAERCAGTVVG